jgi:hypothetical protein
VDAINPDEHLPVLQRTFMIDSTTIVAVFDETVDSTLASQKENYLFDNNIGNPISAKPQAPLFNEVILRVIRMHGKWQFLFRSFAKCRKYN